MDKLKEIRQILDRIYGEAKGDQAFKRIYKLIKKYPAGKRRQESFFSHKDVVLITYGDTLNIAGDAPLKTFNNFACQYLKDAISTVHFLPFFPFSSDDGFSITDFFTINPGLGTWKDVSTIGNTFKLMFDYVVNHFSAKSQWFKNYLLDKEGFRDFAIEVDPSKDLSMVTRPRSLPLLTEFKKSDGNSAHLWTTFSADQIDFNFKSPDALEKMLEVLLFYVNHGASILRLDAIAYLWKQIGTSCVHLPQTHDMVKLFRKILDAVAPDIMILTETNVPHDENISYFGDGHNEAQMVYNFTLPPLLFHTFANEDATVLSNWAKGLQVTSDNNTFFNFTASHDGIGVRPLEGILPRKDINRLVDIVKNCGGQVSYKNNPDGTQSPYELNITYIDAILGGKKSTRAEKFLASQAIQYVLPGVPATYIHSLLGSRNWIEGVKQTKRARTINREKLEVEKLIAELNDPESFRSKIFYPYLNFIKIRRQQPAFHPNAHFTIMDLHPGLFAIKRYCEEQTIYALTNISSQQVDVSLKENKTVDEMTDLITCSKFHVESFYLKPYQFVWLCPENT